MWPFALFVALLMAAVLFLVLRPLLRRSEPVDAHPHDALNVAIYRERIAELDADRASGELVEEDYLEARTELERDLLSDVADRRESAVGPAGRRPIAAVAVGLTVPVIAILAYLSLGTWSGLAPRDEPIAAVPESLPDMIQSLAARLREEPDDADGWQLLARSYFALDQFADAVAAFERAHELAGDEPDLLVAYAEALAKTADNQLTGRPRELLERALRLQPAHQKGLWLAGFAAAQAGRPAVAVAHWKALLAFQDPQSEQARVITALVSRTSGEVSSEVTGPYLDVRIELSPELAATLDGTETVFIYARAVDGPPMPLAAVRRLASELPMAVRLDETTSMTGALTLSSATQVVVGARVSRSGTVTPTSGDLQGLSDPLEVSANPPVTVVIDRVLE